MDIDHESEIENVILDNNIRGGELGIPNFC